MDLQERIRGKRVIIVDDEKDVVDILVQILDSCRIDSAYNYHDAEGFIRTNDYDFAILDIMGVDGYKLLDLVTRKGIPALMLTAHALSPQDLKKSAESGASYYVPKERMNDIPVFIGDILDAKDKKTSPWTRCLQRLGAYYDKIFGGPDWRLKEKDFWEKKMDSLPRI